MYIPRTNYTSFKLLSSSPLVEKIGEDMIGKTIYKSTYLVDNNNNGFSVYLIKNLLYLKSISNKLNELCYFRISKDREVIPSKLFSRAFTFS